MMISEFLGALVRVCSDRVKQFVIGPHAKREREVTKREPNLIDGQEITLKL